jgi:hypothetical protein
MKETIDEESPKWDETDEERFQKWVNTDEFKKMAEELESIDEFEYRWNMTRNKALPSQIELATLAASLATTNAHPDAVAKHALALWKACGKALDISETRQEFTREKLDRLVWLGISLNDVVALDKYENGQCLDPTTDFLPLKDFLRPHFAPNSKYDHMSKKFRDFLKEVIPNILDNEESSLDKVARAMYAFREDGVLLRKAAGLSLNFEEFLKQEKVTTQKERARKGGNARKEKAAKKLP